MGREGGWERERAGGKEGGMEGPLHIHILYTSPYTHTPTHTPTHIHLHIHLPYTSPYTHTPTSPLIITMQWEWRRRVPMVTLAKGTKVILWECRCLIRMKKTRCHGYLSKRDQDYLTRMEIPYENEEDAFSWLPKQKGSRLSRLYWCQTRQTQNVITPSIRIRIILQRRLSFEAISSFV